MMVRNRKRPAWASKNVNEKKSQPYPYRDEGGSDQILRTVCVLQLFDQRAL